MHTNFALLTDRTARAEKNSSGDEKDRGKEGTETTGTEAHEDP
jgi:hypothetical protein